MKNLELALRHLRQADNAFVLWVMQFVLIRKIMLRRKTHRIYMGAIYWSVIVVILQLRDGNALSDMTFDVNRHQASMLQRSRDKNVPIPPEILSPIKDTLKDSLVIRALVETFDRP
jgi:hypothetical protein